MTEQPGPGHMVMASRRQRADAEWVLARPLRQPAPGTSTRPPHKPARETTLPRSSMISRRLPASSSFVPHRYAAQCRVVKPGRRVSTVTGHLFVTD